VSGARPRVAWWSPLPPDPSGIADYSEELLPHLAERWEIDLFADQPPEPGLARRHRVVLTREPGALARLADYDAVVYHLGNGPAHVSAYHALGRHPGLVVLHDLSLAHLVIGLTHGRGRTDRLYAEMRRQHGDVAAERMRRHFWNAEPAPWDVDPLGVALNRRVLERARAVLVHSRFAAAVLRAGAPGLPVDVVEHHALRPAGLDLARAAAARAARREVLFCTAGYLTPAKRIDVVLRALARLRGRVDFRYRLVGELSPRFQPFGLVRDLGLWDRVEFTGRVAKDELYRLVAEADACVNLRRPTSGETSGMVQRVLASGRPVVVSDVGWFAELPDACAVKVAPGREAPGPPDRPEGEVDALASALERLATDPAWRDSLGAAALEYAARLTPESRAAAYDAFVRAHGRAPAGTLEARLGAELEACAGELDVAGALPGLDGVASGLLAPPDERA
jgi:glycosyltransferase involved in cell wall biosynthesis